MTQEPIRITPKQARKILETGRDKAEGIVIELEALKVILGAKTNAGPALFFQRLPEYLALSFFNSDGPGVPNTISFYKKGLQNVIDGIAPRPSDLPGH